MSEEGLKIFVSDDTVIGFANHVDTARAVIRAYFDGRMFGLSAREAIRAALVSVTPCEHEAEVLFAFYEAEEPRLLLINTLSRSNCDVDGLVQLGRHLPAGQHEWTATLASAFQRRLDTHDPDPRHPEREFTSLVALLQSYGVHDYLPQHGVGGAPVAAWVTPTGARWQGDHLYVIHGETPAFEDPMCATMIRADVLCLVNNRANGNKMITWSRPGESREGMRARIDSATEACVAAWDSGSFDYVIALNSVKHIVTIVAMCGQRDHRLVSLHAPQIERRLGIVWTQELISYTNTIAGVEKPDSGHMTVQFISFMAVSEEERLKREQFGWECFVDWNGEPGGAGILK